MPGMREPWRQAVSQGWTGHSYSVSLNDCYIVTVNQNLMQSPANEQFVGAVNMGGHGLGEAQIRCF